MLVPIRTQGSTQATRETSHSPNWRRTTSSDLRPRPPLSSELRFGTNSAATLVPTTMSLCARLLRSYKFREPALPRQSSYGGWGPWDARVTRRAAPPHAREPGWPNSTRTRRAPASRRGAAQRPDRGALGRVRQEVRSPMSRRSCESSCPHVPARLLLRPSCWVLPIQR
jgi:hypothetical protein